MRLDLMDRRLLNLNICGNAEYFRIKFGAGSSPNSFIGDPWLGKKPRLDLPKVEAVDKSRKP
jgi:hypothetical protein